MLKKITLILTLICPIIFYAQNKPLIGNELGILQFESSEITDKIVLLNQDFTEWMSFDLNYEAKLNQKQNKAYTSDDVEKLYNWKKEFSPYAFHMDYAIIMFKCLEDKNGFYRVIVNEQTGLTKYIRKSKLWVLKSWEKHICESVASVGFELESNPLRMKPEVNSTKIVEKSENLDPVFSPVETQGVWLKIKYWVNEKEKFAWIKWREANQIIVELWYLI